MKPSTSRYCCYGLLLLVILFFAGIRLRLRECPLERDEGEYAYAGQLILQGIPPYQLVYSMKLPGTFAAYSVILATFGQTPSAIHIGLLFINGATTFLVFLLAKRLFGALAGFVAGASYALLSTSPSVLGLAGHATHFVALPSVGGILLLLKAIEAKRLWLFFFSGVLLGLAFLAKQPGIFLVLFGGLYVVKSEWHERRLDGRSLALKGGAFVIGVLLPFSLTCLILLASGTFNRFWFWTFLYAHEYGTSIDMKVGFYLFRKTFPQVVRPVLWVWGIACVGLTAVLWNREVRAHAQFLAGFLLFSFLAVCPGLYFRRHYFILMLPAMALLAGVAVSSAERSLVACRRTRALSIAPVLVFLGAFAYSIFAQRQYLFEMDPWEACRATYGFNPFPEAVEVGEYIKRHTSEGARIAVVGSEPEIYFYSRRRSATGYIYTYPLMEKHKYALEMQREMITEIEAVRPEFLVFVNVASSFGRLPGSEKMILTWADAYSQSQYELVGTVDILAETEYVWGEAAKTYHPRSPSFIHVFKRKAV